MEILIFAGYFYPHKGGSENHIYQFAERLAEKRVHVTVLTTNTNNAKWHEKVNSYFEIYRVPAWDALNGTYPIPKFNRAYRRVMGEVSKQRWDIVMTRTRFWPTTYLGYRFAKRNKIPLIHVEHGSCHTVTNNKFVGLVNRSYDHTLGALVGKKSNLVVGVSEGAVEFMKHLGAKKPIVVYRGIDMEGAPKYAVKKNVKEIIFVGRVIYAKGAQDLINAFSQINDKSLKLTVVGDGPYKKELEVLVKDLKLGSRVKFTGEKSRKDVMKLLSQADLFVNPSYSEGLPTSVLEAGAVGLPVIATDVGGTREVIINKKTGLLIKEKDVDGLKKAIEFMISHEKERKSYAKGLNVLVKKNFDWNKVTETWMNMFKKFDGGNLK